MGTTFKKPLDNSTTIEYNQEYYSLFKKRKTEFMFLNVVNFKQEDLMLLKRKTDYIIGQCLAAIISKKDAEEALHYLSVIFYTKVPDEIIYFLEHVKVDSNILTMTSKLNTMIKFYTM